MITIPRGEAEVLYHLRHCTGLPTLPTMVGELGRRLDAPATSAADVARLLAHDQVLTARVLRLANSAFYCPREPVRSVPQAVVMLGLGTVRAIILKAALLSAYRLDQARPLWLHALATACAARALAKLADLQPVDDAFVMGLLHDLGKLALAEHLPQAWELIQDHLRQHGGLLRQAECAVLDTDHAAVGGYLCDRWGLPAEFRGAIAAHHDLELADAATQPWAACLHLSDILARCLLIGSGGDDAMPRLDPRALTWLGLEQHDFGHLFAQIELEIRSAEVYFAIISA